MLICPLVRGFQMFGVCYKLLAQPVLRHCGIIALVAITVFSRLVDVHICPVTTADRRVERLENHELTAATENGLLHCSDFLNPGKLVQFLKPEVFEISPARLDGLRFLCLIQPPEDDFLAGRLIHILHRADAGHPQVVGSQCVNRPCNLFKDGFSKSVSNLTEYHRIAENAVLCVLHHT